MAAARQKQGKRAAAGHGWFIDSTAERYIVSIVDSWHLGHVNTIVSKPPSANGIQVEVRQLRATAKRVAANKKSALRFLAATGMYTLKGELKPQFR